jgi:hypothetical protein
MKKQSATFSAFLLFALMLFKVSSFHVYSHQDSSSDDIENCKICELAVENENAEFVFTASQTMRTPVITTDINTQSTVYDWVVSSSFLRYNFFGRPPPNMG